MPRKSKTEAWWVVEPRSGKRLFLTNQQPKAGEFIGDNLERVVELLMIADVLNGERLFHQGPRDDYSDYDQMLQQTAPKFRELVDAWRASGPNLVTFREKHPKTWADVYHYWQLWPTELVPFDHGGAAIAMGPELGRNSDEEALRSFVRLITNPECDRLAGPCARCSNYYVQSRRSTRNKYCSRSCGTKATATAATKKARQAEHERKLERARHAIREYENARTKMKWQKWVSLKEKRKGITQTFLTRAVKDKKLQEPIRSTGKEK